MKLSDSEFWAPYPAFGSSRQMLPAAAAASSMIAARMACNDSEMAAGESKRAGVAGYDLDVFFILQPWL